ncbi:cysteinyl-tRNA synthetase, putative, partial [Perkinsus marinus ATCC 50983]
ALSTNATGGDFGSEKRHRNDFALWKSSKRGEPSWESPWGLGRPGWHIECSVMASEVLGAHIDIHGGGSDLKFPHHDNEIAQSEAYHFNAQWVNYFLHAGHLHIKGLKMSKSLKNFITIRQALQSYTARQLRIMFLLQQWDKPINFSDQTIAEAKDKETRFNSFFNRVKELLRTRPPYSIRQKWEEESLDFAINEQIATAMAAVHEALCDNFNTSEAMTQLDNIVTAVNSYMVKSENPKATLIQEAAQYVQKMLTIFGVTDNADVLGLSSGAQGEESKTLSNVLTAFASFREQLRSTAQADKNKMLLQMCDDLRDETMVDLGVRLEDKPDGSSVWSLEDPIALKREIEAKKAQKKREARMKERRKLETKVQEKTKELQRWTKALVDPAEFLRDESKYGSWDDAGLPLTFADGSEISKKARKQAIKEMDKHVKDHNEVETRGGESYVQSVEKE